jgi:GntR family transcriptional regulator
MLRFQCDSTARVPIYRQLIEQVREGVARGKLQPGERLPSVRQLSKDLVVNPNTIARAYTELEREGVLNTRPGLGVFVAVPKATLTAEIRSGRLAALIDRLLTEAVHLGFTADEATALVAERMKQFQFNAKKTDAAKVGSRNS